MSASSAASPAGAYVRQARTSRYILPCTESRHSLSSLPCSESLGSRGTLTSWPSSLAMYLSGSASSSCRALGSAQSRSPETSRAACRTDNPCSRIDRAVSNWLPHGNRHSSRAIDVDNSPRRMSCWISSSSLSTSLSRRHTHDLWRASSSPILTWGNRCCRCSDSTTQASSRSVTPRSGRLQASNAAWTAVASSVTIRTTISWSPLSSATRTRLKPSTTTSVPSTTPSETTTGLRIPSRMMDFRRRASAFGSVSLSTENRRSSAVNATVFTCIPFIFPPRTIKAAAATTHPRGPTAQMDPAPGCGGSPGGPAHGKSACSGGRQSIPSPGQLPPHGQPVAGSPPPLCGQRPRPVDTVASLFA